MHVSVEAPLSPHEDPAKRRLINYKTEAEVCGAQAPKEAIVEPPPQADLTADDGETESESSMLKQIVAPHGPPSDASLKKPTFLIDEQAKAEFPGIFF